MMPAATNARGRGSACLCRLDALHAGRDEMTIVSMHAERATARKVVWSGAQPKDPIESSRRDGGAAMATGEDDKARFASIVLPHLADAYSLARWITGNRTDADDVVQDACLRSFRAIWSTADANPRAWVLTIVRNTAYTWLRKNRPAALVGVEDLEAVENAQAAHGDAEAETPETALIAKTDSAHLEAAIAALPAPFRETLVLRDVQGLSYREIADVTGVPIGTVMSRLARGRSQLIKTIGRRAS
jgi:RNA polymerase sigma factor (sigma-70 family)